jgi:hypothetical protein
MMKKTQLISLSKDSERKQDLFVNTLQAMRSQEVTCLVTRLKTYSSTSGESSDQSKENSTNQIHKPAKPKGQGNSASSTTEENIQDSGHHCTTCMQEGQQTKTKLHTRPNHAP